MAASRHVAILQSEALRRCMRRLAALMIASLPLAAGAAAQPLDPESRVIVKRTVSGFRVESIAESDGGRLVRMRKHGHGYRFEYSLEFWRGNGGVVVGATFSSGECRSGDAEAIQPATDAMARETLNSHLREYLRECPLTRRREAELRRSVSEAWPDFSALADGAMAATMAENEAIENYGKED